MLIDGLIDVYNQYHMGVTAENVAEKYQITRKEQDEFAVNSQSKASAAIKLNKFKNEIVPIKLKNGKMFDTDEYPKIGTNIEIKAREVHIEKFEITKINIPKIEFRVICSKGTYIRSLAYDIGKAVKTPNETTSIKSVVK